MLRSIIYLFLICVINICHMYASIQLHYAFCITHTHPYIYIYIFYRLWNYSFSHSENNSFNNHIIWQFVHVAVKRRSCKISHTAVFLYMCAQARFSSFNLNRAKRASWKSQPSSIARGSHLLIRLDDDLIKSATASRADIRCTVTLLHHRSGDRFTFPKKLG